MVKLIAAWHTRPDNQKDRSSAYVVRCLLEGECPLLAKGQCIHLSGAFDPGCMWGETTRTSGPTKRARTYDEWMGARREFEKGIPKVERATRCLAMIGDYVWLPYAFMDSEEGKRDGIPFEGYSAAFRTGTPFMKVADFTPKTIIALCAMKPRALMGGEIKDYQLKSVPAFLSDLYRIMPELYAEAVALDPSIAAKKPTTSSFVGKPFPLSFLPAGVSAQTKSGTISWDGKRVVTINGNAKSLLSLNGIFWGIEEGGDGTVQFPVSDPGKIKVFSDDPLLVAQVEAEGGFSGL